jgi:leader peptidase (prepilin peptidase)/N-methyltransferase
MQPIDIAVLAFSAVLGACFGSFVNAAALRTAQKESFIKGRSKCPHCEKTLRWTELIPLISYLAQRGRCRGCKKALSPRYLLAELICAATAALCFLRFGFLWMAPLAFGVIVLLLAVTLIDQQTMEIPDGLIIALIPLAAAAIWARPEVTLLERGIGAAAVSIPMLLMALIIKGGFGGGDIKLMAVCGFLLGWQCTVLAFFIALVTGVCFALITKKKKGEHFAFGPFLCIGTAAAMLYGREIISAYLNLFNLQWLLVG